MSKAAIAAADDSIAIGKNALVDTINNDRLH